MCCTKYASKFGKFSSDLDWKMLVFIPIAKKSNVKECSNYWTVVLISHVSEVMLKILPAGLQQYMNQKFPYVQAGFSRGGGAVVLAAQWSLTFCDPMDWSPPGSPVHEILQARILVWVAISSPGDFLDSGSEPGSPTLQADSFPTELYKGSP